MHQRFIIKDAEVQKCTEGSAQKLAPMLMGELFRLAKSPDESVTQYLARAHRIHSGLSDTKVVNDQQMVAMAVLRGLPEEFNVVAHSLQQTLSTLEQKDLLNEVGRWLLMLEQELKIKYGAQLPAAHQAAAAFGGARSSAQHHSSNSSNSISSNSRSKDECYICGSQDTGTWTALSTLTQRWQHARSRSCRTAARGPASPAMASLTSRKRSARALHSSQLRGPQRWWQPSAAVSSVSPR